MLVQSIRRIPALLLGALTLLAMLFAPQAFAGEAQLSVEGVPLEASPTNPALIEATSADIQFSSSTLSGDCETVTIHFLVNENWKRVVLAPNPEEPEIADSGCTAETSFGSINTPFENWHFGEFYIDSSGMAATHFPGEEEGVPMVVDNRFGTGKSCSYYGTPDLQVHESGGSILDFGPGSFEKEKGGGACPGSFTMDGSFELTLEDGTPVEVELVPSPDVVTLPASQIAADSAALNATVDANGLETTYQFEYGTTTGYGSTVPATPQSAGQGLDPVEVSETVEGLELGQTYHYRVVATNEEGTTYGKDKKFTTFANVGLGTEAGPVEEGTQVHAVSRDFTMSGERGTTHCEVVRVTGEAVPVPGSEGGQMLEEAEGSGEGCSTVETPFGTLSTEVDRVALGTVEFSEEGTGSLSSVEVHANITGIGSCGWAEAPVGSTWSEAGGAEFGGGGFAFAQQLPKSEGGFLCSSTAQAEADFELHTGEETPVYVEEE